MICSQGKILQMSKMKGVLSWLYHHHRNIPSNESMLSQSSTAVGCFKIGARAQPFGSQCGLYSVINCMGPAKRTTGVPCMSVELQRSQE
jgi:hypothetical protein